MVLLQKVALIALFKTGDRFQVLNNNSILFSGPPSTLEYLKRASMLPLLSSNGL